MEKIIFLDIDGVLITERTTFGDQLDVRCVAVLKKILEITSAKVVISSIWRYSLDWINKLFKDNGLALPFSATQASVAYMPREEEIKLWLKEHEGEVEKWCVIDDDIFDLMNIRDKVIKTSFVRGLQTKHIAKVKKLLT